MYLCLPGVVEHLRHVLWTSLRATHAVLHRIDERATGAEGNSREPEPPNVRAEKRRRDPTAYSCVTPRALANRCGRGSPWDIEEARRFGVWIEPASGCHALMYGVRGGAPDNGRARRRACRNAWRIWPNVQATTFVREQPIAARVLLGSPCPADSEEKGHPYSLSAAPCKRTRHPVLLRDNLCRRSRHLPQQTTARA